MVMDGVLTSVSEYNEAGFVRVHPPLQTGRNNHGCSYYDREGTKVDFNINDCSPILILYFQTYLVSGGYHLGYELSSTELLIGTASAWVYTGELPSPRYGLRGANIDNRVIMTGN